MGECLGGYGVMGVYGGPNVVEDGLVLALDAGNSKGYDNDENLVTDNATDFNYSFNSQIIPTANDVAPNGTTVLCKHDLTGATSPFLNCRANTTLNAGTYTMSMYLKGTTSFNASFAFVGETTSEIYANTANITTEWKRFTLTFTLVNTQTSSRLQVFFATQGNDKIISVWGAQLERGSVATDYTTRLSGTAKNRGTTWTDLSGNGNNGTLVNGVGYNSSNLGSLVFDGVDKYVTNNSSSFTIANDLFADTNGSWTVSAWFKFPVLPTQSRSDELNSGNCSYSIFGKSGGILTGATFTLFVAGTSTVSGTNTNKCMANIRGVNTTISNTLVNTNTWYNAIVTWDGATAYGYLNASSPTTLTVGTATVQVYNIDIGTTASLNDPPTGFHNFEGNIAQVSIYNRALTPQEIQQNFIATRSRFGI
jgi:hypothetical protein